VRSASPESAVVDRLLAPDPILGVPIPAYAGRSLTNLTNSVVRALGGREGGSSADRIVLEPGVDPFGGRRAPGPVVVLLLDGFGWDSFEAVSVAPGEPLGRWRAAARPITSVFPTTTTAALTSLSTGVAPATHGLVGYHQYLPRFGVVTDLLRMSPVGVAGMDLLVTPRWRPTQVRGVATRFRDIPGARIVSRDRFEGTGFSRVLYEGAGYTGYATGTDLAHQLVRLLDRDDPPPLTFAYWDELDTVQHLRGPGERALVDLELGQIARLVAHVAERVAPSRARRTTVLITGDHGQVPAARARQLRVDRVRPLAEAMARPLAGDRRAGFFAARPGRGGQLETALRRRLPPHSRLLPLPLAIERGLFGPRPRHPELEDRTGDWLALVPPGAGLVAQLPGAPPARRHLDGAHGGLDRRELLVPLVAARLADLGTDRRPRQR